MPKGDWYLMSYGIVAMYKQNWDNFGGFSKDFFQQENMGRRELEHNRRRRQGWTKNRTKTMSVDLPLLSH